MMATYGQEISNLRLKTIALKSDTTTLDTLSIIPGTFKIQALNKNPIDTSLYSVNHGAALLIVKPELWETQSNVKIKYRVFPLLFEQTLQLRNYQQSLSPDSLMGRVSPRFTLGTEQEPLFGDQIQTNGSIMRGIRFGNNQDLSVNSSMNLTFSGELGNDLMIEGAISDQSVPLQPDGTTRRLEEFDRIYLRVHREGFSVQAGDIEMRGGGNGELLTFARNVQGLSYHGAFASENDTLIVETALAVPKGKFARNSIQGNEGNQGPYRLQGNNGEPYIIILSGSERVYVDGVLLTRGENQHYVINYNSAELVFTHRMPINRNSRIQVEFEYSERSYARFNTYAHVEQKRGGWDWHISAFSEQDSRNQPFDQELTDEQKQHLASIGNNLDQAFYPQVEQVEFDPEKILYQMKDTLVDGQAHSVFKHSTNPSLAQYRVYFSFVGQGQGNYTPDFGTANGRVYRWVAPQGGVPQGSYEPIRRLIPPQKRQMVQAGVAREWGDGSYLAANYALSNADLNSFSPIDSDKNIGHGIQASYAQQIFETSNSTSLRIGADALKTTNNFRTIDRFRPVEFEREWSILSPLHGGGEQMLGSWIEVAKPKRIYSKATLQTLNVENLYKGIRGGVNGWSINRIANSTWDVSMVSTNDTSINTTFYRAKVGAHRTHGFLNFRLMGELENSASHLQSNDSLLSQSFSWYEIKASVASPDTLTGRAELTYTYREDYKPFENRSALVGKSQELSLNYGVISKNLGALSTSLGYRLFSPNNAKFTDIESEERTVLARIEYAHRLLKGAWVIGVGYELGSGLEPDQEYYFVEVPAGQGVYTWVDYNENGIMELDEFEIANYPDEARFIRINIPGSKMISVRNNALSLRSNLNPASLLKDIEHFGKYFGRLSNQTSYRVQQKNRFDGFWESANPFVTNPNDTLITSMTANLRNSLAYNRTSRRFGVEYILTQGTNKAVLANGYEQRETESHRLVSWVGFAQRFSAKTEGEQFETSTHSEHFIHRNYTLFGYNAQQSIRYVSEKQHNVEVGYKWNQTDNKIGDEKLLSQTLYINTDLVFVTKGAISVKTSFVSNRFEGQGQSAVAYEMMKGLQSGRNVIWDVSIRRKLSRVFELELGYNGRYLNDGNIVHSGSMQARALF